MSVLKRDQIENVRSNNTISEGSGRRTWKSGTITDLLDTISDLEAKLARATPSSQSTEGQSELLDDLKIVADDLYCQYIAKMKMTECLGEAIKMERGEFGMQNLEAHREAARLYGKHVGMLEVIAKVRAALRQPAPASQPSSAVGGQCELVTAEMVAEADDARGGWQGMADALNAALAPLIAQRIQQAEQAAYARAASAIIEDSCAPECVENHRAAIRKLSSGPDALEAVRTQEVSHELRRRKRSDRRPYSATK